MKILFRVQHQRTMASSNNLIRFYFIALAALFASSFLVECEATTVSLTSGPYSNSRRQSFGSRGWTTRRSQVSPALLDDAFEDENYKEVEECSVGLYGLCDQFVGWFLLGLSLSRHILFWISHETSSCHADIKDCQEFGSGCISSNSFGSDRWNSIGVDQMPCHCHERVSSNLCKRWVLFLFSLPNDMSEMFENH